MQGEGLERLLVKGKKEAENIKLSVKQALRDRRRQREIDQVCNLFLIDNKFFILV